MPGIAYPAILATGYQLPASYPAAPELIGKLPHWNPDGGNGKDLSPLAGGRRARLGGEGRDADVGL